MTLILSPISGKSEVEALEEEIAVVGARLRLNAESEWIPEYFAERYKTLWDRWTSAMARRYDDAV